MGHEWESVFSYLGFEHAEIQRFTANGKNNGVADVAFTMLVDWQKRQPQEVDVRKALGDALEKSQRLDLATGFHSTKMREGMPKPKPLCPVTVGHELV